LPIRDQVDLVGVHLFWPAHTFIVHPRRKLPCKSFVFSARCRGSFSFL
jgi:hypothetical protein